MPRVELRCEIPPCCIYISYFVFHTILTAAICFHHLQAITLSLFGFVIMACFCCRVSLTGAEAFAQEIRGADLLLHYSAAFTQTMRANKPTPASSVFPLQATFLSTILYSQPLLLVALSTARCSYLPFFPPYLSLYRRDAFRSLPLCPSGALHTHQPAISPLSNAIAVIFVLLSHSFVHYL